MNSSPSKNKEMIDLSDDWSFSYKGQPLMREKEAFRSKKNYKKEKKRWKSKETENDWETNDKYIYEKKEMYMNVI